MDHAKLRQIYEQAKAKPPQERAGFLLFNCGGDEAMRAEIQSLLDSGREPADPEAARRDRMRVIFDEAMKLASVDRATYVRQQCGGDEAMYQEIAKHLPWDRASYVREVFTQALNLSPEQRDPWLRQACRDDSAMYEEIMRMLQAYQQPAKPDRSAVMREIFSRALTLPIAEREAFVRQSCGQDDSMFNEIMKALPQPEPPPVDRPRLIREIFEAARNKPVEQREAFVRQASAADPAMAAEILQMLAKIAEPTAPSVDRFAMMRKIFDSAMTKPVEQRDAFLRFACGNDESMRAELSALVQAQSDAGTFLQTPAQAQAQSTQTIGPYRIIRELGRGGMGVVYLGMRDDGAFRKAVALKVLRGDQVTQDFLRRFREERQTLANLDHPYIARILDGGDLPDGMPYYVMDFIEGLPLDDYSDKNKLAITDRIKLFQKICEAVDYLHTNRVVHRDLKPANILVANDGTPKLLDFGIAKQQGNPELTAAQERLLTPGYASPEQIYGGQVSAASDIYTLGVILYFMLTGQLPYDDPHAKVANIMAGIDPPKPSTRIREDLQRTPETTQQLRKRIIGDLDNIVLMALRREPTERYTTARELAEDLQRFLDGRSVLARKDSIVERGMKFVKRNRIPVSIAAVLVLALGFGAWQTLEARMLANKAEAREAQIRSLLDMLDTGGAARAGQGNRPRNPNAGGGGMQNPGGRVDQVRQLRRAFEQDFAAAWSIRPGFTPERQQLMDRSIRYLDGMRPYCAQDPSLALEVAGAYQQLGIFQDNPQYGNRNAALGTFNNAIILLNGVAGGNPNDPRVQGQLMFLAGRVRALGGSIPIYVSTPLNGGMQQQQQQQAQEVRRAPIEPTPSRPREATPEIQMPATTSSGAPASREEYNELKERLISVTSKIQIAEDSIAPIKQSVAQQGHTLHPDVLQAMTRMHMALDTAKKEIAQNDWESAKSSLNIAEANANRVLKFVGR
jgi:serine/threonine protein kinase